MDSYELCPACKGEVGTDEPGWSHSPDCSYRYGAGECTCGQAEGKCWFCDGSGLVSKGTGVEWGFRAHLNGDEGRHHVLPGWGRHPQVAPEASGGAELDGAHEQGDRPKATIGTTATGRKAWFDPDCPGAALANAHLSITGESGSGKTQAMKSILADLGVPALVLDFKDDYAEPKYAHREGFQVFDPTKRPLPFNPLEPLADPQGGEPNTTYHAYQLAEILGRIYHLGELQQNSLREAIKAVYGQGDKTAHRPGDAPQSHTVMFKVAPPELRETIQNEGLASGSGGEDEFIGPPGPRIYAWSSPEDALKWHSFASEMARSPRDIWKIDTRKLDVRQDPIHDDERDEWNTAHYIAHDRIGPEKLELYHSAEKVGARRWPSFQQVEAELRRGKGNAELLGHLSPIFDFGLFSDSSSAGFSEVAKGNTVIRLAQLPGDEVKNAVAELFLMQLYSYLVRLEQTHLLRQVLVLDEAWRVVRSPFLEPLMREARAFGLGVFVATQFPTDLPLVVSGSAATSLYFSQSNPDQVNEVERIITGGTSGSEAERVGTIVRGMLPLQCIVHNKQYEPYVEVDAKPYYARYNKEVNVMASIPAGDAGPGQDYLFCGDCFGDTSEASAEPHPQGGWKCGQCGSNNTVLYMRHPEDGPGYEEWAEGRLPRASGKENFNRTKHGADDPAFICTRCQSTTRNASRVCSACEHQVGLFEDTDSSTAPASERVQDAVGDPDLPWQKDSAWKREVRAGKGSCIGCDGSGLERRDYEDSDKPEYHPCPMCKGGGGDLGVTFGQLGESKFEPYLDGSIHRTPPGIMCPDCQVPYSGERGDYWQEPDDKEVVCGDCGRGMRLVQPRRGYDIVGGWKSSDLVPFPPGEDESEEGPFAPFSMSEWQMVKGPRHQR